MSNKNFTKDSTIGFKNDTQAAKKLKIDINDNKSSTEKDFVGAELPRYTPNKSYREYIKDTNEIKKM